jgi:hypothetical protein
VVLEIDITGLHTLHTLHTLLVSLPTHHYSFSFLSSPKQSCDPHSLQELLPRVVMEPSSSAADPIEQYQQQSPEEYHEVRMAQSSDSVRADQLGESMETSLTGLNSVSPSIDINTSTATTASPLSQLVEQIVDPALFPACDPAISSQTGFDPSASESSLVPPDTLDELVDFPTAETAETPLQLTEGVSDPSDEPDLMRQARG